MSLASYALTKRQIDVIGDSILGGRRLSGSTLDGRIFVLRGDQRLQDEITGQADGVVSGTLQFAPTRFGEGIYNGSAAPSATAPGRLYFDRVFPRSRGGIFVRYRTMEALNSESTSGNRMLLQLAGNETTDWVRLFYNVDNGVVKLVGHIRRSDGGGQIVELAGLEHSAGEDHTAALVWGMGEGMALYLDGHMADLVADVPASAVPLNIQRIWVGTAQDGKMAANCALSDIVVWDNIPSAEQIGLMHQKRLSDRPELLAPKVSVSGYHREILDMTVLAKQKVAGVPYGRLWGYSNSEPTKVAYSDDLGESFTTKGELPSNVNHLFLTPTSMLVVSGNKVYRSTDDGVNFTDVLDLGEDIVAHQWSIAADVDFGRIWCSTYTNAPGKYGLKLYRTEDDGETWTEVWDGETALSNTLKHIHMIAYDEFEDLLWMTIGDVDLDYIGLYYSSDGGETFTPAFTGRQITPIWITCDEIIVGQDRYSHVDLLYRWDRRTKTVRPSGWARSQALTSNVYSLFVDRDGVMWFSTRADQNGGRSAAIFASVNMGHDVILMEDLGYGSLQHGDLGWVELGNYLFLGRNRITKPTFTRTFRLSGSA